MKSKKENECGGIIAYIGNPAKPEGQAFDGISFSKTFANFLTKQPYYQCGIALNDSATNQVKTAKFISRGVLAKEDEPQVPKHSEDSDDDTKADLVKQIDYGYKENAII